MQKMKRILILLFVLISCVGCGRCTRQCPVNIDIYSIVEAALKA